MDSSQRYSKLYLVFTWLIRELNQVPVLAISLERLRERNFVLRELKQIGAMFSFDFYVQFYDDCLYIRVYQVENFVFENWLILTFKNHETFLFEIKFRFYDQWTRKFLNALLNFFFFFNLRYIENFVRKIISTSEWIIFNYTELDVESWSLHGSLFKKIRVRSLARWFYGCTVRWSISGKVFVQDYHSLTPDHAVIFIMTMARQPTRSNYDE